jgi:nicotinate-nucleotide adenylyltransferase
MTYKKPRAAIFGGAYDPVHFGHMDMGSVCASSKEADLDHFWWMPAYSHNHGKKMADPDDRMEMLNRTIDFYFDTHNGVARIGKCTLKANDYEIHHRLKGGTMNLIESLRPSRISYDYFFVIGQDNADTMYTWTRWEELIDEQPFIVVPSKGYPRTDSGWYHEGHHIYIKDGECREMSSTGLKQAIARGQSLEEYTAPAVESLIKEKKHYGFA